MTVGQYKLSLGLTKAQVQEVVGSSVYSKAQIGTSPQGYESYTFNPGDDFKKVIEVQFKNNVVVEMSTIGSFSYGDDVQSGNTTSALSSKGFSDKSGSYKYTLYSKSTGKEYIDVVVDSQRGGQVYGVQIFDKNLGLLDKLLYPKNCTYNSGVNKYQAKLSAYYLNAYRVYHGVYEMSISEEGVAQSHSEYMAEHNSDTMDEGSTTWKTRLNDNYNDGMGLLCKAEYTSYGSPDAFSAVTYAIAKQGSDTKFYKYILMTECVDKNGDTQEVFDLHIECGFANTTSGNKLTFSTFDFYEPL